MLKESCPGVQGAKWVSLDIHSPDLPKERWGEPNARNWWGRGASWCWGTAAQLLWCCWPCPGSRIRSWRLTKMALDTFWGCPKLRFLSGTRYLEALVWWIMGFGDTLAHSGDFVLNSLWNWWVDEQRWRWNQMGVGGCAFVEQQTCQHWNYIKVRMDPANRHALELLWSAVIFCGTSSHEDADWYASADHLRV